MYWHFRTCWLFIYVYCGILILYSRQKNSYNTCRTQQDALFLTFIFDNKLYIELFHQPTLMHNFLYSLTMCLLHYYPRHVSSINMPIFRRKNCIHTASGIFALKNNSILWCTVKKTSEFVILYFGKTHLINNKAQFSSWTLQHFSGSSRFRALHVTATCALRSASRNDHGAAGLAVSEANKLLQAELPWGES